MKNSRDFFPEINVFFVLAIVIIAAVMLSLAFTPGGDVAAAFAVVLLVVVLVLGVAAGRADSQAEIERLRSVEDARRVQVSCMVASRNRLEDEIDQLRELRMVARDGGNHAA